ncbi:RloB family protein [Pontibacter sp. G13]|uniref:RloB family protein n=1 Tax=Pontibacter sp. G13 TaxID=3074898 RepID=UPI00288B98B5|nr:RloB family protein [Pontibacter sp. G13]WNJ17341.1 RloB family protein [Pontibacter sp. G13]
MPRKNRSYKKGGYFRDSYLLVIACEGAKREKEYFEKLVWGSQRIKLKILSPEGPEIGNSSPKWVLDRAAKFDREFGLGKDDLLWMVMDKDRWDEKLLREIYQTVQQSKGWNLAISNPCFEVWLLMHYQDLDPQNPQSCSALKKTLGATTPAGFDLNQLLDLTKVAIDRAKQLDLHHAHFLPQPMTTNIYLLIDHIRNHF